MKLIRIIFFILFATVICSVHVHAQAGLFNTDDLSHVNIDNYSDDELTGILQKANESGISQPAVIKIGCRQGITC